MDIAETGRVLFLCTGNYYRSRFAEVWFNAIAEREGLPWRAWSRGLAVDRSVNNVGPMALSAIAAIQAQGIQSEAVTRMPLGLALEDLVQADCIIALHDGEHRPLVLERFPAWEARIEYWDIEDALGVLPRIERAVTDLIVQLRIMPSSSPGWQPRPEV